MYTNTTAEIEEGTLMPGKNPKSDPTLMTFINNLRLTLDMDEIPGTSAQKGKHKSREGADLRRFYVSEYSMSASRGFGMNGMRMR